MDELLAVLRCRIYSLEGLRRATSENEISANATAATAADKNVAAAADAVATAADDFTAAEDFDLDMLLPTMDK